MTGISQLFKQFKRDIKASTGTDYTATVTRVEGGVAYVQLTGSDIPDTPATLSVDARPGDKVRVRVRNGKAWVNGNDTLPPSNDKKEVATKMSKDMSNRNKHIIIRDGVIKFVGDTLVVESKNFQLDEIGNATFSGTLDAAGGSFAGNVQVVWKRGDDLRQQVVAIGVDDKDAPIQINWPVSNGGYTQIMGGKIRVGYTTTGAYCDLLPSGISPSSTSSGSLSTTLTGGSNYKNNVTNRAGIVNVDFHRANFTAWNMSGPFATIPTGFRPSVVEYVPGAIYSNGSWIPTYFSISTNGSVSVGYNPAGSGSTCTHLWFCGTYSI